MYAPIILFVFKRPDHTKKSLEALLKNPEANESILYVFSDGSRNEKDINGVKEVRQVLQDLEGFKEIIIKEEEKNKGLNKSIIEGVSHVLNIHKKAIVLEDDIVTSKYFLKYMNNALNTYEKTPNIWTITGYNHPPKAMKIPENYNSDVYFNIRFQPWGWATWKDRWDQIDWELKDYNELLKNKKKQKAFKQFGDDLIDQLRRQYKGICQYWDITLTYNHFNNNAFCVWPTRSFVNNIGFDGTGMHNPNSTKFENKFLENKEVNFPDIIQLNTEVLQEFRKVFKYDLYTKTALFYHKIIGKL